jgi:GDPmannose 4,6-dehydratase
MKKALITGITGQDGSYLAEFLLEKGYEVFGLVRRNSIGNFSRIEHIRDKITLLDGDISDVSSIISVIKSSARRNLSRCTVICGYFIY